MKSNKHAFFMVLTTLSSLTAYNSALAPYQGASSGDDDSQG